jgi:hypothetical protein
VARVEAVSSRWRSTADGFTNMPGVAAVTFPLPVNVPPSRDPSGASVRLSWNSTAAHRVSRESRLFPLVRTVLWAITVPGES